MAQWTGSPPPRRPPPDSPTDSPPLSREVISRSSYRLPSLLILLLSSLSPPTILSTNTENRTLTGQLFLMLWN